MNTLDDLRAEYQRAGIGPLLHALLDRIVWSTVREYPAAEYSSSPNWDRAACEDALHDWIVQRLWGRGDLQVMLMSAASIGQFRAALTTSLRQHLGNKRRRSIASNLYRRVRSMMQKDHSTFRHTSPSSLGAQQHWTLVGRDVDVPSTVSVGDLAGFACTLSDDQLDVVRYGPFSQKLSPILRDPKLREFIVAILTRAAGSLSLASIVDVMRIRFSLPTEEHVELDETFEDSRPDPSETAAVNAAARSVVARLDCGATAILAAYFEAEGKCEAAARKCEVPLPTAREAISNAFRIICEYADSPEHATVILRTVESLLIQRGE
jgi:hypothetical protein